MKILSGIIRHAARIARSPHLLQVRFSQRTNMRRLQEFIRDKSRQKSVLISRVLRLGDVIAAEPISRAVKELYPQHGTVWCVRPEFAELVRQFPAVDTVLPVLCLTEAARIARSGLFDKVFELHFEGDYCRACKHPLHHLTGDTSLTMSNYTECRSLLEAFARAGGVQVTDEQPLLKIPEAAVRAVENLQLPERYVAVHCFSAEPKKNWPAQNWRSLITHISGEMNMSVVEIGLKRAVDPGAKVTDLCGRLSILEAAEVIRRADLFVGPDSGPAHLANAVQTKGLVLLSDVPHLRGFIPFSGKYADPGFAVKLPVKSGEQQLDVAAVVDAIRTMA